MRIGLEHIDPRIAAEMRDRLCAPGVQFLKDNIRWAEAEETSLVRLFLNQALHRPEAREPEEIERLAFLVHRQRERMTLQRALTSAAGAIVAGVLVSTLVFQLVGGHLFLSVAFGAIVAIGGMVAGGLWAWQATSAHELHYEVTLGEFEAVAPLLTLTDVEAAYYDLLTRVCERDPNQEARRAVRRHLHRVTEIVVFGRRLDSLHADAERTGNDELAGRIDAALDELVEAVHGIADALCAILVVPSPAGDKASERIETEMQRFRALIEEMERERAPVSAVDGKRRRVKVS